MGNVDMESQACEELDQSPYVDGRKSGANARAVASVCLGKCQEARLGYASCWSGRRAMKRDVGQASRAENLRLDVRAVADEKKRSRAGQG